MSDLRRILLVDDSVNDVKLMISALRGAGLANPIETCRDGAEALDYLFRRGLHAGRSDATCPCVVLLDLKMPKVDGLEVLAQIRQDPHFKTLPVVMITSSAEEKDMLKSYKLGVNAYVVKPVTHDQFLEAIKNVGLFWAVVNRPSPEL
ncbi:MAG: response regulator [Opitutaceae bacterium]|nr:response regulator [Opitutaceae bacterium]